ncbi:MAG: hypothetical protein HY852_25235 [Bradyrhizobium sp.]|nr:hypothetical protein [Bradyrhizobium sp.]
MVERQLRVDRHHVIKIDAVLALSLREVEQATEFAAPSPNQPIIFVAIELVDQA